MLDPNEKEPQEEELDTAPCEYQPIGVDDEEPSY
tara:strand:+ start:437 stop:538 length:102 start_codon:yes stop_codon:yes gene_type:complete